MPYVLVHLPTGAIMKGTLETICATSAFDAVDKDANGVAKPIYSGDTEVCWDSQETVRRLDAAGTLQRVFFDEAGYEYLESELTLMDYAAYNALES